MATLSAVTKSVHRVLLASTVAILVILSPRWACRPRSPPATVVGRPPGDPAPAVPKASTLFTGTATPGTAAAPPPPRAKICPSVSAGKPGGDLVVPVASMGVSAAQPSGNGGGPPPWAPGPGGPEVVHVMHGNGNAGHGGGPTSTPAPLTYRGDKD